MRDHDRDLGGDDGAPLDKEQTLYTMTERALMVYLVSRIMKREPFASEFNQAQANEDKVVGEETLKKLKGRCEMIATYLVMDVYKDWFDQQMGTMREEDFVSLYHGMHGPNNLFRALFPEQDIDTFLAQKLPMFDSDGFLITQTVEQMEPVSQNINIVWNEGNSPAENIAEGIEEVRGNVGAVVSPPILPAD